MQRKLTVSQLNEYIAGVFEDEQVLHGIIVTGEISDRKKSGYRTFFSLRDGEYALSCVSFAPVNINDGDKVEVTGYVSFYKKSGRVSFIAESVELAGEGDLVLKLKALKEKLLAEGIFANRPPLPEIVKKICVITSESGAVIHDILSVVRDKNPMTNVLLFDTRVQGGESARSIIEALEAINRKPFGCDVIIIARGGGSSLDLNSFNDEALARAVSKSAIPIISAIGHETDYTLCDLAASKRAGTPSIAAELAVTPLKDYLERIYFLSVALASKINAIYSDAQRRVVRKADALSRQTDKILGECYLEVKHQSLKMQRQIDSIYAAKEDKTKNLMHILDKLSPLKVLSSGYAKVLKEGKEVSSASELNKGEEIGIVFADGKVNAEII